MCIRDSNWNFSIVRILLSELWSVLYNGLKVQQLITDKKSVSWRLEPYDVNSNPVLRLRFSCELLKALSLETKTTNSIKKTQTNTRSKVKFRGETYFKAREVKQGGRILPLLFNYVLERMEIVIGGKPNLRLQRDDLLNRLPSLCGRSANAVGVSGDSR